MTRCDELRELLPSFAYGELGPEEAAVVIEHLDGCPECRAMVEALGYVAGGAGQLRSLTPPDGLALEIGANPCRRWLRLLFAAVDHELPEDQLERLLSHLEGCPACRSSWADLTLIHQVGEALIPPPGLAERSATPTRWRLPRRVLGVRTATAAAYLLAVLTSLLVGNPVSLARYQASQAVGQMTSTIHTEVAEAASSGQGELKIMLYRVWRWGSRQADALKHLLPGESHEETSNTTKTPPEPRQGGTS